MTAPEISDAVTGPITPVPVDADTVERCSVCGHDTPAHDSIGLRYCRATQENALTRHCICRV